MKPPLFIQSVFGILGGIGPHPDDVMHMKRTADRLFGDQYRWSVLGAGATRCRSPPCRRRWAATCASGWRTACGSAPASSPSPTPRRSGRCGKIIEGLGLEVATPDDARRILALKGGGERRVLTRGTLTPTLSRKRERERSAWRRRNLRAPLVFLLARTDRCAPWTSLSPQAGRGTQMWRRLQTGVPHVLFLARTDRCAPWTSLSPLAGARAGFPRASSGPLERPSLASDGAPCKGGPG